MKKIIFISGQSRIYSYTNMPLIVAKNILFEKGYNIKISNNTNPKKIECDILIILSKYLFNKINETERILSNNSKTINFIKKCRKNCKKIIWIDNSDSTSITHFELMPFIDLYLKKQIFKDKSLYRQKFIGGRIFTDFYHKKYNINYDGKFSEMYPLNIEDEAKLKVGWNIGLGDVINSFGKFFSIYNRLFPDKNYNRLSNPHIYDKKRNINFFLKTSVNLSEEIISFHRIKMIEELNRISKKNNLNSLIQGERLSQKDFLRKMKDSMIMPSPFGWGELGARDYEAFYYGACLFKPRMDHMETWPNIFVPNETYVPIDWDFNDLENKLIHYINDSLERKRIAKNGQEKYLSSISNKGLIKFTDHFIKQIE
tara:strand:- start:2142 stop:3251 length:1110 start_codon:yes stop_codon:yes gene_type:complete